MRIEEAMFKDKELQSFVEQYRPLAEAQQVLTEEIQDKVAKAAKKYYSDEPPESIILRDPDDPDLHVVFLSGDGKNVALRFMNGKVVEQKIVNNFTALMSLRDNFVAQGYEKVDSREWYKRNWKMILGAFLGGAFAITITPLIAGHLAFLATFIKPFALLLGWSGAAQLAGGGLAAIGFTRAIDHLKKSS